MVTPTLSVDALNTQNGLRYDGSENFIDCVEFQNNLNATLGNDHYSGAYPKDAALFVARHINTALYCEIFGNQTPTQFLLESWIAQQAKTSTDPQIRDSYSQHAADDLFDSRIGPNDMDYFFHVLSDRANTEQLVLENKSASDRYDHISVDAMKTLWDPKFGTDRAAAELTKTKKDDLKCGPTTHQNDHVVKPQAPATTNPYTSPVITPAWDDSVGDRDDSVAEAFRKAIEDAGNDDVIMIPFGGRHDYDLPSSTRGTFTRPEVDAFFKEFDTPPAPKPFTRELTHYTTQKPAGTTTERLRYTISGNAITVEVIGADGKATKTLNVPAAKLPEGQISSPEGTYITTDGRMVASIPVYAVLNFKDGKPSTDAALDMIEITWDAKGTGPADNPYGVAVETFVAPGTHSGAKLKNQSSLDLDGDGKPETLQTHKMQDHHLANRSTPDALGQSTNPTGWEADTQTTDADEPHARIQIHMSSIGTPVQK